MRVWAIGAVFFHATVSTLVPIAIVEHLWPSKRHAAFLGKAGLALSFAGFCGVTILGMLSFGNTDCGRNARSHFVVGLETHRAQA